MELVKSVKKIMHLKKTIEIIAIITIDALRWSCKKYNINIGGINGINDFKQPFPKYPSSFLCSVK